MCLCAAGWTGRRIVRLCNAAAALKPAGFYCHRYVLAASEAGAIDKAFRRVRLNLDSETGWLRDGLATVNLKAEKVAAAPVHKLLKPDNRGHTFYEEA